MKKNYSTESGAVKMDKNSRDGLNIHNSVCLLSCLPDNQLKAVMHMEDILVVDDDRLVLAVVKYILGREGITALCVESGKEALEKLSERTFSLMITDFNMPGLDGLELSRIGLKIAPQMPIIMDTGSISPEITRLAKEIGISKVLPKPFLPNVLLETIRDVMGKRLEVIIPSGLGLKAGTDGAETGYWI